MKTKKYTNYSRKKVMDYEQIKELHPNIARFYRRWGAYYNRQVSLESNPRHEVKSLFSSSLNPADSNLEEMFVGSLI